MKSVCFCRFLLAVAILVVSLVWWATSWAQIVVAIAAALLAIMSLFYNSCCCRGKQE